MKEENSLFLINRSTGRKEHLLILLIQGSKFQTTFSLELVTSLVLTMKCTRTSLDVKLFPDHSDSNRDLWMESPPGLAHLSIDQATLGVVELVP